MKINYSDKRLELIMTDQAHKIRVPISVIISARKKLQILHSAPDERTLRNWKSLHFEKLSGNYVGKYSIKLNDQWRFVLELDKDRQPHEIKILSIEDYH